MSTTQRKYYDKIIDGYLCTFNSDNHLCVSVLLATGMDIEKTTITMVCSDFNAVEVEIPAEAYGVPMGEHVHAE